MGNLLNLQNKDEKALSMYKEVAKTDPENEFVGKALHSMGKTLQKLNRHREAISTFEQIQNVEEEDQAAEIQFRMAECYQKLEELEEAILEYLKVVYLYPASSNWTLRAQESVAICLEKQGRIDDASKVYGKILDADPDGVKGELARQRLKEIKSQKR